MNGMNLTQVAVYDLVELSGNSVKLNVKLTQNAANQKIQRKRHVGRSEFKLVSSGGGDMKVDLSQLIASPRERYRSNQRPRCK